MHNHAQGKGMFYGKPADQSNRPARQRYQQSRDFDQKFFQVWKVKLEEVDPWIAFLESCNLASVMNIKVVYEYKKDLVGK